MSGLMWALLAGAWLVEALLLGLVMGRRGYDAYAWTVFGLVFGPAGVAFAVKYSRQPPSRAPKLLRPGKRGPGSVDVLIGVDGSPEAEAAIERVAALFSERPARVTLAHVVPLDAEPDTEHAAETLLAEAARRHPDLDPTTVILRGEPVAALRDYLTSLGYEVLVVGTRGRGRSRLVLGSVASELARGAGIPVLLVDDQPSVGGDASPPLREAVR